MWSFLFLAEAYSEKINKKVKKFFSKIVLFSAQKKHIFISFYTI